MKYNEVITNDNNHTHYNQLLNHEFIQQYETA